MYDSSSAQPSVPEPHSMEAPKSPARVTMHGDMTKKMKVGEPAAIRVKGDVRSMSKSMTHPDHYDVEIDDPEVEHINESGDEENIAKAPKHKEDLASMPKEKLKAKIMKKDDSSGY